MGHTLSVGIAILSLNAVGFLPELGAANSPQPLISRRHAEIREALASEDGVRAMTETFDIDAPLEPRPVQTALWCTVKSVRHFFGQHDGRQVCVRAGDGGKGGGVGNAQAFNAFDPSIG